MKKRIDLKNESGAALVLEATIIYPIVLISVLFLIIWGLTFIQRGYLQYSASQLSTYIAKTIVYPGYQYIDLPFYSDKEVSQLDGVNAAMDVHHPYRYFFGLDSDIKEIMDESTKKMVEVKLPHSGFMKAKGGSSVIIPDDVSEFDYVFQSSDKNGYVCAITAKKGFARVYLGQNYVFSDFFRMIGLGGRKMTIYGDSLVYMSDSVEILRTTDWAYETANMLLEKAGIDFSLDKIKQTLDKITHMGD